MYIDNEIIESIKHGENYRFVTWNLSSGETKKFEELKNYSTSSSIRINIEKKNA